MLCAIWYHLHNVKNVKNTHGGVKVALFHGFFMFFKSLKWYQIAQSINNL